MAATEETEEPVGVAETQSSNYAITRTMPDELLRHDISDEELEMLKNSRHDQLRAFAWAMIALAAGAAPAALNALFASYAPDATRTMSLLDQVQVTLMAVGSALGAGAHLLCNTRSKDAEDLAEKIRKRTRRLTSNG
jgi:hypothetical protein